jgi:hypothetical protein
MVLPDTASNAELLTTTVMFVKGGNPAPFGVKVTVSPAADQANVPLTGGTVEKAACTLFVFMGSLN